MYDGRGHIACALGRHQRDGRAAETTTGHLGAQGAMSRCHLDCHVELGAGDTEVVAHGLSTRAVQAIRAQQHHVRDTCPDGSAGLFSSRSHQNLPLPYDTFREPLSARRTASVCTMNMVFVVPIAGSATGTTKNFRTMPLTAGATNPVAPGAASVIPPTKSKTEAAMSVRHLRAETTSRRLPTSVYGPRSARA